MVRTQKVTCFGQPIYNFPIIFFIPHVYHLISATLVPLWHLVHLRVGRNPNQVLIPELGISARIYTILLKSLQCKPLRTSLTDFIVFPFLSLPPSRLSLLSLFIDHIVKVLLHVSFLI